MWHIDTTVVRLVEGGRVYLYAVIDNYSRRILGWRVSGRFDPTMTLAILEDAAGWLEPAERPPILFADGGVENRTKAIDEFADSGILRRVLAQTDIAFSNSMIESWWRALEHQWLFLNKLDSVGTVRRLTRFYVDEHNSRLPHSAFSGQTPDEVYFGTGRDVPDDLEARRKKARFKRMQTNRARSCRVCRESTAS